MTSGQSECFTMLRTCFKYKEGLTDKLYVEPSAKEYMLKKREKWGNVMTVFSSA